MICPYFNACHLKHVSMMIAKVSLYYLVVVKKCPFKQCHYIPNIAIRIHSSFPSCIAQLKAQGKAEAAAKKEEEPDTSGKTYLQLLKEKRDYKRRRQKYRAKNVHITRKTPTEVLKVTSWTLDLCFLKYY